MNVRSTGYFHFPLCLLAFRSQYKDRLQHIVSYCLCEHAQRLNRASGDVLGNTALDEAAKFLHVSVSSADSTIDRWKAATRFIRQREGRYGRDASVRIATALLWEAHNNTGLTYREFSILCAINSVIGNKRFVSVAMIKPVIRPMSSYLGVALSSPQVQIQMVPKGSGLQHIHLEDLREDCIPLPPHDEQVRIVEEVERRLSVVAELEDMLAANEKRAAHLREAILQQAFASQESEH